MFISVLELFKIGIGPSSSHTLGPMVAAGRFISQADKYVHDAVASHELHIKCTLRGSLAFTGRGHATDRAVALGLHGYLPEDLAKQDVNKLLEQIWQCSHIHMPDNRTFAFHPDKDVAFDKGPPLPQHPNGIILELVTPDGETLFSETYFSIGGGFICTVDEIADLQAPLKIPECSSCTYPFDSANAMLQMSTDSGLSIAQMKHRNELDRMTEQSLVDGLDRIIHSMQICISKGLEAEGILPGGLDIHRRAKDLYQQIQSAPEQANLNDWLCAYAMAVNEENAAGHMVVTAPTNGAAGVIPAVLHYFLRHEQGSMEQAREFLLTAAAIGGLIKHRSSISGAEVGCQGEVGSASAMAAAGLCAVKGGTMQQVENAAEIALEHHLGMTCDPVNGLVQVPCIERNGFGAIKAYTAASLALHGSGEHFMPLDNCIAAMKQTGLEMLDKFKETAQGGLAVSLTEC